MTTIVRTQEGLSTQRPAPSGNAGLAWRETDTRLFWLCNGTNWTLLGDEFSLSQAVPFGASSSTGTWNATTQYNVGDQVTYGSGVWLCTSPALNVPPTPWPSKVANDTFSRAPVSNGWGTADIGGAWTPAQSGVGTTFAASYFSTENSPNNAGVITPDNTAPMIALSGVSLQDAEALVRIVPGYQTTYSEDQGVCLRVLSTGGTTWWYQANAYPSGGSYTLDIKLKSVGSTVTNTILGAEVSTGIVAPVIGAPGSAPTVAPTGGTGSTTWKYVTTWINAQGETNGSPQGSTTTGVASLNGTTYNALTLNMGSAPAGATGIGVYRSSDGGTTWYQVATLAASATTWNDTGAANGKAYSSTNTAVNPFWLRFQVVGTNPTALRAKIWADGATEPLLWSSMRTDSTSQVQASGGVGAIAYINYGGGQGQSAGYACLFQQLATTSAPPTYVPTSPWAYLGPTDRSIGVWVIGTSQTSVPHGLPYIPKRVRAESLGGNAVLWPSASADATNVYLTSNAANTNAEVFVG